MYAIRSYYAKKGRAGRPMQVNVDIKTSVSTPISYVDVYSGDELRQIAYSKPDLFPVESSYNFV